MRFSAVLFAWMLMLAVPAAGQVPFPLSPSWESIDQDYSTGGALVDINLDGWLDLVVANGNDMKQQHVVVYYNKGNGTFPTVPDWQSADIDYHGHLAVGDVNSDGFPDIAVSVYIGVAGFSTRGYVKLYLNVLGELESTPSWRSADSLYTFSCAFGDANGDGRPDLAVACGEAYGKRAEQNRVYFNRAGRLDSVPAWKSNQPGYGYDVAWGDVDNDGRLDLVFANEHGPNAMYKNYGDSLATVPSWQSADTSLFANSLSLGDVNKDGLIDLAVSDNFQLGGSGHFKCYLNQGGVFSTLPDWNASFSGYESGILLADITNDGWLDLIGGGWWESCRVFLNMQGTFGQEPSWTSSTESVVEVIVAGDVDNSGLDTQRVAFAGDGFGRLFTIPGAPVQRLLSVTVGGTLLTPADYCGSLEDGWMSLAVAPVPGDTLAIVAVLTHSLDLAITNWDPGVGNYLFLNDNGVTRTVGNAELPREAALRQNFPNPFNGQTVITYTVRGHGSGASPVPGAGWTTLTVFDLAGREVARLVDRKESPGEYTVRFDASGLPSGVYFYRLQVDGRVMARKMVFIK